MQDESKQPPTNPVIKRALSHPKRLEMLGYLTGKEGGTEEDELADALGLTPPLVKYHLGVLQSADLVAYVEGSARRAAGRYIVAVPS